MSVRFSHEPIINDHHHGLIVRGFDAVKSTNQQDLALDIVAPDDMRTCCGCGHAKLIGDFYRKGTRVDSRCKDCIGAAKAKAYKAKKKRLKPKGVRQIEFDRLTIQVHQYDGPDRPPDFEEVQQILQAFVWEAVHGVKY